MSNEHTYEYEVCAQAHARNPSEQNEMKPNSPKNEQQQHFILSHNDCGNGS